MKNGTQNIPKLRQRISDGLVNKKSFGNTVMAIALKQLQRTQDTWKYIKNLS
jgi:hypothetical protein